MKNYFKCSAFLLGSDDKPGKATYKIVENAGFASIFPFTSLADIERVSAQTPICFILFEQVDNILSLQSVLGRFRKCRRQNVRFFPLIYLCNTPSPKTIRQCVNIGFDDIIALPIDDEGLKSRLARQLNRTIIYFETKDFFGPDRRRISDKYLSTNPIPRGVEKCLQYKFIRDVEKGIIISSKAYQPA